MQIICGATKIVVQPSGTNLTQPSRSGGTNGRAAAVARGRRGSLFVTSETGKKEMRMADLQAKYYENAAFSVRAGAAFGCIVRSKIS